jgi:hypothetical protein
MVRSAALLILGGCASGGGPVVTDGGTWTVAWASEVPPDSGEPWTTTLTVTEGDLPAEDVTLTIEPFHPSMGHGIFEEPVAEDLGAGVFLATWTFNMTGRWEVRVDVTDDNRTERGVFEVEVR